MELASLFTDQRWNILKFLSNEALSPLQLAKMTNTTIANVSQQLRLLEAANLVSKIKVPNRDKGKPRSLFSLTDDYAYVVSLMSKFTEKKLIKLNQNQKRLLRILSIDDVHQRERVERLYYTLHNHIDKIKAVGIDISSAASVIVITSDRDVLKKLDGVEGVKLFSEERARDGLKNYDLAKMMIIEDRDNVFSSIASEREAKRKIAA